MIPSPKALQNLHLLPYQFLPPPSNRSHSEHAQAPARTNFHLSLRRQPRSMAPSMAPVACAVKQQAACDTRSRSSMVNQSHRRCHFSLSAMRHLRGSRGCLRICSRRRHCHCHLKKRQLNRHQHHHNSNERNLAGHPSLDRVPLLLHRWSHYLLPIHPPRSSRHSLLSMLQVHQQPHILKWTKKGLTLQVQAHPERTSTTEASPSTKWASAKSLVLLPRQRRCTPPHKLPVLRRKARPQPRCIQPFQKYRDRLPVAHQQCRLRRRPHPVRQSRLPLHRHHCLVRTMERRAVVAR